MVETAQSADVCVAPAPVILRIMLPFLQFLLALIIIITAAKVAGYLSYRLGLPSVLGELLIGIIIGPSVLDFLHWPSFTDQHLGETIEHLAEIGVLLLMFIAGLDLHLSDLARSGKVAALAGVLGVLVPLGMGAGVGLAYGRDLLPSIFIGLILAATSVSISAQTLMELGVLRSRVGISMLGAAVFDDILVILGLSVAVAVFNQGGLTGLSSILVIALRMGLFMLIATLLGFWTIPRLSRWVDRLPVSQGLIAFSFVVLLFYAWTAEVLGSMAAITGAFLAGLIFARSQLKDRIEAGMSMLAYPVFVPIFFVNVGLSANVRDLTVESLGLLGVLILVAVFSKIVGAGLGAKVAGLSSRESLQLGVGMMSRGEVGLIVATVGITEGLIGEEIFSTIVGVVIVTTLLTPLILRSLFADRDPRTLDPERVTGD